MSEIVRPALLDGRDVVSDRFIASALAYQGYGRGLSLSALEEMLQFATGGIEADLTVLLDLDTDAALARLGADVDRIEGAGREFHDRVRNGYLQMAAMDPARWIVIDASGSIDEVGDRVLAAVRTWIGSHAE